MIRRSILIFSMFIGCVFNIASEESITTDSTTEESNVVQQEQIEVVANETIIDATEQTEAPEGNNTMSVEVAQEEQNNTDQESHEKPEETPEPMITAEVTENNPEDQPENHIATAIDSFISQITCLLFTLIGNNLSMEKYSIEELANLENGLGKTTKNTIFTINLAERGLTPKSIQWSNDNPGQMKIITGKKDNQKHYALQLDSLFNDTDDDVMAICFDCKVKNKKSDEANSKWQSHITVNLPVNTDNTEINVVLGAKIKAACGFFMEESAFSELIKVSGKINKVKAIESELIKEVAKETESESRFSKVLNGIKNSACYIKDRIVSVVLILKQFMGKSLRKKIS